MLVARIRFGYCRRTRRGRRMRICFLFVCSSIGLFVCLFVCVVDSVPDQPRFRPDSDYRTSFSWAWSFCRRRSLLLTLAQGEIHTHEQYEAEAKSSRLKHHFLSSLPTPVIFFLSSCFQGSEKCTGADERETDTWKH